MIAREIVVDNFAGGGGASTGIEAALGYCVDVALNHDPIALAMHEANHPHTRHLCQNISDANPLEVTGGRPVGLAWFSPDCKHFSKAKGGKPVEKRIRDLAWVVVDWAKTVRPRVIMLENVEEFQDWGPLLEDGRPCPASRGLEFRRWVRELRKCGYAVEWRELRASHFGTPTIRKRLFVIARRDGRPIVWPAVTHGAGLQPFRTAAEIIDWSIPCPSIFGRKRPLAEATMRRIARGIWKFVLNNPSPFIVPVTHTTGGNQAQSTGVPLRTITCAKGGELAFCAPTLAPLTHQGSDRCNNIQDPLRTVTGANRGELALVAPVFAGCGGRAGQSRERGNEPLHTCTSKADTCLVSAFLAQHNTGEVGHQATKPISTICSTGSHQAIVTSNLLVLRNNGDAEDVRQPLRTVTAGGWHLGEVRAFLLAYYGTDQDGQLDRPLATCTTHDRFGIVTIHGTDYQIVDIGMRMLTPRELFRAQGFPESYVIDPIYNGKPLSKTAQVRCCGNSVCPPVAEALVRANFAAELAPAAGQGWLF